MSDAHGWEHFVIVLTPGDIIGGTFLILFCLFLGVVLMWDAIDKRKFKRKK